MLKKKYVISYGFSLFNIQLYGDTIIPYCFDDKSLEIVNQILETQISLYPTVLTSNLNMHHMNLLIKELYMIIKSSAFSPIAKCRAINIIELILSNTDYELSQLHEFYEENFIQNIISLLNISFAVHKGSPVIVLMRLFQEADDEIQSNLVTLYTEIPQLIDENINDFEINNKLQEAITFVCDLYE